MKKYIKPQAIGYTIDTESILDTSRSLNLYNEEGNGIQRSKSRGDFEEDDMI